MSSVATSAWPEFLDSQEFYDLMQSYRLARPEKQSEVWAAWDNVRFFIRDEIQKLERLKKNE